MSWRDRLQSASIRGVGFHIDSASGQAGRRVAVHEYPQQEVSWAEDLGKKAGSQTLQAFVVGADYDLARDELFAALDKPGPATLVHPYLGTLKIQVTDYDWTISTRQGGYCKVTISYVPAGKREYPATGSKKASELKNSCDAANESTQDNFAKNFTCENKPAFVEEAAIDQLTAAIDTIRSINGKISSVLQPISDVANQIDQLGSEIATLISQPRVLASRLMGVVASVFGAVADIKGAFNGYKGLFSGWSNNRKVKATTPNRRTQAVNQAAIEQLLKATATVEFARLIATTTGPSSLPFETYDQAMEIRDRMLEELDTLIESGDDALYHVLVELQTRLIRRVDDTATELLRIDYVQITTPVPALVFAHQVCGDAARADELATRNALTDPNFVPAGTDIEVLL